MPNWQVSVSSCSRYLITGLLRRDCQSPVGVIFDRFNVGFAMSDCPLEADIRRAGIYDGVDAPPDGIDVPKWRC